MTEATTILVADDDRLVRVTLSDGLRKAGYRVLEAANGLEAVEVAMDDRPNLAILDLRMPELPGIEAASRLREEAGVSCIVLSAYDSAEDVDQAVREGALGYLVKPVDVSQVLPAIETALARADEIRRLRESEASLNKALTMNRETSVAVGILLARHHLSEDEAFEALRGYARAERRRLAEVAADLIAAETRLNTLSNAIASRAAPRRGRPARSERAD